NIQKPEKRIQENIVMTDDEEKVEGVEPTPAEKKKKGKGKTLIILVGGFFLSFAVICVGMYFVMKTMRPPVPPQTAEEIQGAVVDSMSQIAGDIIEDNVVVEEVPAIDLTKYGLPEDSLLAVDQVKRVIAQLEEERDDAYAQLSGIRLDLSSQEETSDSLQQELAELLQLQDKFDATSINRLARIFESMKAKEAAPVMVQLSDNVNVTILMKMKERPAAKILSEMPVSRAAAISRMISQKVLES
ncbi:hypothetical protein AMJ86_09465, partial [bacterium SM23_57]